MAVTLADCTGFIDRNLDGGVEVVDAARIINTVGQLLCSLKAWTWLERGPTLLGTTADQAYIDLPSDFGTIITLQSNEILNIRRVEWEAFVRLRRGAGVDPVVYAVTLQQAPSGSGGEILNRLAIYPTPSATVDDVMNLVYTADWVDVSGAAVTAGTALIPIPSWIEPLWYELLQAVARGFEEDDAAVLSQRLELVRRGPLFAMAMQRDSSMQREHGYLPEQTGFRVRNLRHLIDPSSGVPSA